MKMLGPGETVQALRELGYEVNGGDEKIPTLCAVLVDLVKRVKALEGR